VSSVSASVNLLQVPACPPQKVTAAPPRPESPTSVHIQLFSAGCYGKCPVYRLDIMGTGQVTYEGLKYVKKHGKRLRQLDPAAVTALVDQLYEIGFFQLEEDYVARCDPKTGGEKILMDAYEVSLTVTVSDVGKTVRHAPGVTGHDAPEALREMGKDTLRVTGADRWIR
jgi:Domain of unknown function (DUF6438)